MKMCTVCKELFIAKGFKKCDKFEHSGAFLVLFLIYCTAVQTFVCFDHNMFRAVRLTPVI